MKFIFYCVVFGCLTLPINAQQPKTNDSSNKVQLLDEIVFSVNKWEQKINEVPNKIVKVNFKDDRLHNPQTAADLLGMTGAVYIQKSQLGGGSPMIRGFSTNRILIVVDGVRMNNAIYRSGNLQNIISVDALSMLIRKLTKSQSCRTSLANPTRSGRLLSCCSNIFLTCLFIQPAA